MKFLSNEKLKKLTNEQRNEYVDKLLYSIAGGDLKAKLELFNIVCKLFDAKYKLSQDNLRNDLKQDLWFRYEKALLSYNGQSPFLSYIYGPIKNIFSDDLTKYMAQVKIPSNISPGEIQLIPGDIIPGDYGPVTELNFELVDFNKHKVSTLLKHLKPKEVELITLYFGLDDDIDRTQADVADILNTSRQNVHEKISKILKKLRKVQL